MNILIVLTSHEELGATRYPTGLWLGDLTHAYFEFLNAGADITMASPSGGSPPIDPRSLMPQDLPPSIVKFRADAVARRLLSDTLRLEQIDAGDFDAAFLPGGHGALWDLATDKHCRAVLGSLLAADKPVAMVGHAAAALLPLLAPCGRPFVAGRELTCYSDSEEAAGGLSGAVPYSLQQELIRLGAHYRQRSIGASHVVADGPLITGQNHASALQVAARLVGNVHD